MFRVILFLLFVYLCVIIVRRMLFPKSGSSTRIYYKKYTTGTAGNTSESSTRANKNLDQIEDADFEVIDEKKDEVRQKEKGR
jgi:hypothetical protein